MPDYSLSKIYKITSPLTDQIYIGSTSVPLLSQRLRGHVSRYKEWKADNTRVFTSSFLIIELGNYQIELIERYPCTEKDELIAREQHYIRENKEICCNIRRAKSTPEDVKVAKAIHYQKYIKEIRKRGKIYRDNNPEKIKADSVRYYETNKEIIKGKVAAYREENRDIISARNKVIQHCDCGSTHTKASKSAHLRSFKHQTYVQSCTKAINKLTELTGESEWAMTILPDLLTILEEWIEVTANDDRLLV